MENELKKFDVAELTHMEIYTPNPDGTVWFFKKCRYDRNSKSGAIRLSSGL